MKYILLDEYPSKIMNELSKYLSEMNTAATRKKVLESIKDFVNKHGIIDDEGNQHRAAFDMVKTEDGLYVNIKRERK
jgi:hypothetical protein